MKKYFVASDIHGFFTIYMEALQGKGFDIKNPNHIIIICGDAFDRGHEAVDLFNFLSQMKADNRFIYIKGNHEYLLDDCYNDLITKRYIEGRHHYSNGTVDTISQFTGFSLQEEWGISDSNLYEVKEKLTPVLELTRNTQDYCELGDYIFVHGWIPKTPSEDRYYYYYGLSSKGGIYNKKWREEGNPHIWKEASWLNGMEEWELGIREPGKTIICGHWHASWGNAYLHDQYEEWPRKGTEDYKEAFKPFFDDGIIAIDGCTAYSDRVNVLVFEEISENSIKLLDI